MALHSWLRNDVAGAGDWSARTGGELSAKRKIHEASVIEKLKEPGVKMIVSRYI